MKQKRLNLSVVFLLVLGLIEIQAQEVIPVSGGNASGSGGNASYSVGQLFFTENIGETGTSTQGVQQPYEISIVTSIDDTREINLFISAFPNPTSDYLKLIVNEYNEIKVVYELYDLNGTLLENKKVTGNETIIQMNFYKPSVYFLKIIEGDKKLKTFKIIKN